MKTIGYAAHVAQGPLTFFSFERRPLRPDDVAMEIIYCGVCHSDLHTARSDWPDTIYPNVPGHEIVGRVTGVGSGVTQYGAGDIVAVGCMVDSCGRCPRCHAGEEQFCCEEATFTYNSPDRITGANTYGGYSKHLVVREAFVLRVPDGLDPARTAPLLCAGITTYSPLRRWNAGPGSRIGVAGMGGLGHMAVKLAIGLGAEVTVLSRSPGKAGDALAFGAGAFVTMDDAEGLARIAGSLDLVLDTVPVPHGIDPYLPLLKVDGTLAVLGQIGPMAGFSSVPLLSGRRRLAGSLIGGIRQTQELLDFCARKNILPECEMICMDRINEAFERMERADVRYRFVIDMASLTA